MCKHINGMWTGGAAYVNPHEYKNTSYFCSYIVIWVVSQEKEALDLALNFFISN